VKFSAQFCAYPSAFFSSPVNFLFVSGGLAVGKRAVTFGEFTLMNDHPVAHRIGISPLARTYSPSLEVR